MSKSRPQSPRTFLQSAIAARKRLLRTGQGRKWTSGMNSTMQLAESLLERCPSDATVLAFIRRHATNMRDIIPARTATDSRLQYLNQIVG